MSFIATLSILDALKAHLTALEISAGVAAFQAVEYYSQPRLIQALQDLRVHKNRVCLIVPDDEVFENELSGRILITRRTKQVIILLADRQVGRRQDASTGNDSGTYGVETLGFCAMDELTGLSLGLAGCRIRPTSAGPVTIEGTDREKATGREAWRIELDIEAGIKKTTL